VYASTSPTKESITARERFKMNTNSLLIDMVWNGAMRETVENGYLVFGDGASHPAEAGCE
jgi:hypothetical protein